MNIKRRSIIDIMGKRRKLEERDSCKNCDYRRWGPEEGWDKCEVTGDSIGWGDSDSQVCDDHKRTKLLDPRVRSERICPKCKTHRPNLKDIYCPMCGSKYVMP